MQFLGGIGDLRLVIPGTIVMLGFLTYHKQYDVCRRFLLGMILCIAATFLGKLIGLGLERLSLTGLIGSPSGHTALSATFVGALALIWGRNRSSVARGLILTCAALLVLAIASGRIENGAHTSSEVIEGLAIGFACLLPLAYLVRLPSSDAVPQWPLIGLVAVMAIFRAVFPTQDLDMEWVVALLTQYLLSAFKT